MAEKVEVTEFDECKACGSKDTLVGRLRKKVEEKGLKLDGYPNCLGALDAAMQSQKLIPIAGFVTPAGRVEYDVCMKCGALRALKVSISQAILGVT